MPDLVVYDKEARPESVKYDRVALYLLAAVKELKSENASLEQKVEALERKMEQHQFALSKEVQQ